MATRPKHNPATENLDPLNINGRLYAQIGRLLEQLEAEGTKDEDGNTIAEITMPQRINALIAIGRVQTIFANLRLKTQDTPNAGSAVRKYANAFANSKAAHGARRRASGRSAEFDADDAADDAAADSSA